MCADAGFFLAEEHGASVAEIQKLEEQERQRRVQEYGMKEEHYLSRNEIKEIEERERLRRLRHAPHTHTPPPRTTQRPHARTHV